MVKRQKLLYIDTPFFEGFGGDKNRSRFLYDSLSRRYETDILLITDKGEHYPDKKTICPSRGMPWQPAAVYSFSKQARDYFSDLLKENDYDIVFIRFCSPAVLANIAAKRLPTAKIVVDVDMLLSRISSLSWQMNKSINNRYYFIENLRLKLFEWRFFRKPYLFLFSNPVERDMAVGEDEPAGEFDVLANIMPPAVDTDYSGEKDEKYLLFFGALSSAANKDAFNYFARHIYHRIEPALKEAGVRFRVVGKDMLESYQELKAAKKLDLVDLVGRVDDIDAEIRQSLFVVLPLRVASGTRTRILETAAAGKGVVTTSIGAEGLSFTDNEIAIANNPAEFAQSIESLLQDKEKLEQLSKSFKQKCLEEYSGEAVAESLINKIESLKPPKLKVAIATNRFYPEVGGAETNIFFQARRMSKDCDVTVFCPKRIEAPSKKKLEGFTVRRLKDFFNLSNKYPNIKTKTFTPSIFFEILFGAFDVVMCFPALSYNNMLAFIACKLTKRPIIMCCFDWLDYSDIMLKEGKIDVNMLERHTPKRYQQWFLRRFDYIFAISEKEIAFFKEYNPNVGYSPVPILLDEYDRDVDNPRFAYGIDQRDFVFLSLGRVSKIKGQDIAAEAFTEAAEEMPGAKLVFVGRCDYDPEIVERIKSLTAQKGLTDRVIFTGMVERDEVLGWLRNSDIHVIPVRFMNSGAVVVESWISHTPVLQSDVVDPNLVKEGETGYLFKSENVEDLAAKMRLAYNNRENLRQMGKNGEQLVREKYTYEYLNNLYLKTFDEVMKR